MEIRWLKSLGLVDCLSDYFQLPIGVLEDAMMLYEYEVNRGK